MPGVKNGEDDDMWYRIFVYYSVAITKHTTTVYRREESGATNQRYFVTEWVFEKRVPEMLNDQNVSQAIKECLTIEIETRKLSYVRFLLISGEKRKLSKILEK